MLTQGFEKIKIIEQEDKICPNSTDEFHPSCLNISSLIYSTIVIQLCSAKRY